MTTAQKVATTYQPQQWGGKRRVRKLPVPGYTHRWEVQALADPNGARPRGLPSTIDAAHDLQPSVSNPSLAQQWDLSRTAGPLLHAPASGHQFYRDFGGSIAGPVTLIAVGTPKSTASAFPEWMDFNQSASGNSSGRTTINVSNTKLALGHGGVNILSDVTVTTGHVYVIAAVLNGADSSLTIDGIKKAASTALPTTDLLMGRVTVGSNKTGTVAENYFGALVIYPGALTDAQIAKITAYYRELYP